MSKPLDKIKHGDKILAVMGDGFYFVADLEGHTGLDPKSFKQTMTALMKNGYIVKNEKGLLYRQDDT